MAYKQYIIELTDSCNFACRYCYLSESEKLNTEKRAQFMSTTTGEAVIDYLGRIAQADSSATVIVDFLDGEPLMNSKLLMHMVLRGREMEASLGKELFIFRFTSNGALLTREIVDFCFTNDVYFNISVDGIPASHDMSRLHTTGKPTSREVHHKLDWIAGRSGVGIVSTYTPWNCHFIEQSVDYFMGKELFNLEISFAQGLTRYTEADIERCVENLRKGLQKFLDRYAAHDFRFRCNELDNQLIRAFSARRNPQECSYPFRIDLAGQIEGCDRIPGRHNSGVGTVFREEVHNSKHFCRSHEKSTCSSCDYNTDCTPCIAYVERDVGLLQPDQPRIFCAVSKTIIDMARAFREKHFDDPVIANEFDRSKKITIGLNEISVVNAVNAKPEQQDSYPNQHGEVQ